MSETKVLNNALLKGIMTDVFQPRSICVDFDTATKPGCYIVYSDTPNAPSAEPGFLLVFNADNESFVQVFFSAWSGKICKRVKWGPNLSNMWFAFDGTELTASAATASEIGGEG